ncbi:hypothetical protein QCN27_19905 [Cereibacter sp. SYSU M97828]|nr:hypothetical protein [Cereibacter flavus]
MIYVIDGARDRLQGSKNHLLKTLFFLLMNRLPPLIRLAAAHEPPTEENLKRLITDTGIGQRVWFSLTPMLVVSR